MDKITVVCHKDHDKGYEDFQGKCLLCVVDELMLEIGNLMIQKQRAEKREWVGLTDDEANQVYMDTEQMVFDSSVGSGSVSLDFPICIYRAIEAKLKEKNGG
jgi:hypothetical protein